MPSRSLTFHRVEDHGVVVTPRALGSPEANVFDKAFSEGLSMEEWDHWMRWEGTTKVELPPSSIERSDSMESSAAYEIEHTPPTSEGSMYDQSSPLAYPRFHHTLHKIAHLRIFADLIVVFRR